MNFTTLLPKYSPKVIYLVGILSKLKFNYLSLLEK